MRERDPEGHYLGTGGGGPSWGLREGPSEEALSLLSERMPNCLRGSRARLLPPHLLSLVSCHVSCAAARQPVLKDKGAEPPAQHTGQVLWLTSLGFSVREGLPTWAAGTSWNKWLREEKESMKMRLMSE